MKSLEGKKRTKWRKTEEPDKPRNKKKNQENLKKKLEPWRTQEYQRCQRFGLYQIPDEQLAVLQVAQVEELPYARRPLQDGKGTQVRQVLLEGTAPFGDGLGREVSPQLFSCRH